MKKAKETKLPVVEPTPVEEPLQRGKWLKIGLLSALAIILLGGAYSLGKNTAKTPVAIATSPTPISDPTADWKTYTDQGFSIKYPSDWTALQNETLTRLYPPGVKIKNGLGPDKDSEHVEIFVSSFNPKDCRGDCPPSGTEVGINDLKNLVPSAYKTSEGAMATMCACEVDKIYINNNGTFYTIGLYGLPDVSRTPTALSKESEEIFKQMVSTFKFTDSVADSTPTPTTSTTTGATGAAETINYNPNLLWQTFADNQGAYQIKFPEGYKISDSTLGKSVYFQGCGPGINGSTEEICTPRYSVVIDSYDGGSRRVWLENKYGKQYMPYYQDLNIQEANALLVMVGNPGGSTWSYVLIPRGSRMYVIHFPWTGWDPNTGDKDASFIKQVLSTFKFL